MIRTYLLLVGNPMDGVNIYGPYDANIFDIEVGEVFKNETWWITECHDNLDINTALRKEARE